MQAALFTPAGRGLFEYLKATINQGTETMHQKVEAHSSFAHNSTNWNAHPRQQNFNGLLVTTHSNGPGYSDFVDDGCEHIDHHTFCQEHLQAAPGSLSAHTWSATPGMGGCGHPTVDVQHFREVQGPRRNCSLYCPLSCSLPWPWCWALAGHHLKAAGSLQKKVSAPQGLTNVMAEEHARGCGQEKSQTQHTGVTDLCLWPDCTGTVASSKFPSASSKCNSCPQCPICRAKTVHCRVGNTQHFHC